MENELDLIEGLLDDFKEFKSKNKKNLDEIRELAEKGGNPALLNQAVEEHSKMITHLQEDLHMIKARGGTKGLAIPTGEQTTQEILKEAFAKEHATILKKNTSAFEGHKFTTKDAGVMTATANLTGSVVASYASQPATRMRRKLHFRDLVNIVPSTTGVWKFYRSNTPTGEGSFDFQTTHGNLKSALDYDLTEVTITADYLAGYARIAKQMLQDLPFLQSFVTNELIEDYLRAEDNKFFGQLYSAATGNSSGVTSTVTAERIIQAVAALREADQDPNGIVVTNAVWAKLLNTKPNDYSVPGGLVITPDGQVTIAGIPVFPTVESNIGANRMLIGDWSKAAIIQTEGLSVKMYEQDQDNAIRNLITIVAESRVALGVLRPEAWVWITAGTT